MVRFGIIGVGNMGTGHAQSFDNGRIKDACLTAICDIRPERTDALNAKLKTKAVAFDSAEKLFDSGLVDAVIIATPHYIHPDLSISALKKGLHVVCEKPAGVYTKQVKEMNDFAKKSDKLFTMMFNQRTNCLYRKMRELVQNGELGEIRRLNWIITDWYRPQFYYDSGDWRATWKGEGGGVLFNQCPHQLDLLQWICGMMPSHIRAFCHFGKWHNIEVEDDVTAYLEYPNGATGVFITTTADTPGTNRFEITGNNGKLVCEKNKLTFYRLKTPEREFNKTTRELFATPGCEVIEVPTDGQNPQHVGILNNFTATILGKEKLFVDGTEGLNGVILMDAMLLSTWLDKKIALPFDDDLYLSELQKRIDGKTNI